MDIKSALNAASKIFRHPGWVAVIVAIIFGIWGIGWGVYTHTSQQEEERSAEERDKYYVGKWLDDYSWRNSDGSKTTVRGTTEYFETGSYNFSGVMKVDAETSKVNASGIWFGDSEKMIVQLTDFKSNPAGSVERQMPTGTSDVFDVIWRKEDRMRLGFDGPLGNYIEYVSVRQ